MSNKRRLFRKGDKVIVIDDTNSSSLTNGEIYKVARDEYLEFSDYWIDIVRKNGSITQGYFPKRFKLITSSFSSKLKEFVNAS